MRVRLYDWFELEDATGEALDVGELVTYLNDAILLAPSLLLGPGARWSAADEGPFEVTFSDRGLSVSGVVAIDARGAPLPFTTTDRFYRDPDDPKREWRRTQWATPVDGWELTAGAPRLPAPARRGTCRRNRSPTRSCGRDTRRSSTTSGPTAERCAERRAQGASCSSAWRRGRNDARCDISC